MSNIHTQRKTQSTTYNRVNFTVSELFLFLIPVLFIKIVFSESRKHTLKWYSWWFVTWGHPCNRKHHQIMLFKFKYRQNSLIWGTDISGENSIKWVSSCWYDFFTYNVNFLISKVRKRLPDTLLVFRQSAIVSVDWRKSNVLYFIRCPSKNKVRTTIVENDPSVFAFILFQPGTPRKFPLILKSKLAAKFRACRTRPMIC